MDSPFSRFWHSPVERLISSGAEGAETVSLHFAHDFAVACAGYCFADVGSPEAARCSRERLLDPLGLTPLPDVASEELLRRNLALADAVVILMSFQDGSSVAHSERVHRDLRPGQAVARYSITTPVGNEFEHFLRQYRPRALMLTGMFSGSQARPEEVAHDLLCRTFRLDEPRDPDTAAPAPEAERRRVVALRERFPKQLRIPDGLRRPIGPGWLDLIKEMCAEVEATLTESERRHFHWDQIKEKFGLLRAYYTGGPVFADFQMPDGIVTATLPARGAGEPDSVRERVDPIVRRAVEHSARTCEVCGAAGELRMRSWRKVLCDLHATPGWVLPMYGDFP